MSSALDRARALAAALTPPAAESTPANGSAAPANEAPKSPTAPPPNAAPVSIESPKLGSLTDALEKRCDEFAIALEASIGDIESSALDLRLSGWLHSAAEQRRAGGVTIAVAGMQMAQRAAAACGSDASVFGDASLAVLGTDAAGTFEALDASIHACENARAGLSAIALVRPERVLSDAHALGTLRRECAGLLWLGPKSALPPDLADCFAEAPLGVVAVMPGDAPLAEYLRRAVPDGALPPLRALVAARRMLDLAGGVGYEHARENERLIAQSAIAERARGARSLSAELGARRELAVQIRDELARDLQALVDELSRFTAQMDAETLLRVPLRQTLEAIPALRVGSGKLVHVHEFEVDERHQWFTGSRWERMASMFPRKMRLSLPTAEVRDLSKALAAQAIAMVAKQAVRRIDAFDHALADFAPVAHQAGVDLNAAAVTPEERMRFERKADARAMPTSTSGGGAATLEDRSRRTFDSACEREVKSFHIDIERKGPIGRIMEARTAVMGISFLVMTGVRVSGAWGQIAAALKPAGTQAAQGFPWTLVFNVTLLGVFFIFLGLIVNAITEEGKEDAMVTEKIADARDALEDKLLSVMERFVNTELGSVKALLGEHRVLALDRLDRSIDAKKQEIDELERKARAGTGRPATRPGLAPLPMGLKAETDKTSLAARDLKIELTARIANPPPAATAVPAAAGTAATARPAPKPADAPPAPLNPALAALAERTAKRAAERAAERAAGDGKG